LSQQHAERATASRPQNSSSALRDDMQGVQVVAARNDENSTQHGAAVQQLKASSSAPMQAAKQGSVLKSARKAFGNITNNAAAAGRGEASAGKPSVLKQPAAQQQPRRALGDITNSAAKPQAGGLGAGTAFKMQQDSKLGGAPAAAQAAPASAASSAAVSSRWAGDLQPERPAGKTWEQLEAERWADMEAEAAASADAILASLRRLAVPRPVSGWLQVLWQRRGVRCPCSRQELCLQLFVFPNRVCEAQPGAAHLLRPPTPPAHRHCCSQMPLAADSDDDDEDWTAAATSSWQRRPQHEQPPSSQDDAAECECNVRCQRACVLRLHQLPIACIAVGSGHKAARLCTRPCAVWRDTCTTPLSQTRVRMQWTRCWTRAKVQTWPACCQTSRCHRRWARQAQHSRTAQQPRTRRSRARQRPARTMALPRALSAQAQPPVAMPPILCAALTPCHGDMRATAPAAFDPVTPA
jgi:hypothetical protein